MYSNINPLLIAAYLSQMSNDDHTELFLQPPSNSAVPLPFTALPSNYSTIVEGVTGKGHEQIFHKPGDGGLFCYNGSLAHDIENKTPEGDRSRIGDNRTRFKIHIVDGNINTVQVLQRPERGQAQSQAAANPPPSEDREFAGFRRGFLSRPETNQNQQRGGRG